MERVTLTLGKESLQNLFLSLHHPNTRVASIGNCWAAIQALEQQYAERYPDERADWINMAAEDAREGGVRALARQRANP